MSVYFAQDIKYIRLVGQPFELIDELIVSKKNRGRPSHCQDVFCDPVREETSKSLVFLLPSMRHLVLAPLAAAEQ